MAPAGIGQRSVVDAGIAVVPRGQEVTPPHRWVRSARELRALEHGEPQASASAAQGTPRAGRSGTRHATDAVGALVANEGAPDAFTVSRRGRADRCGDRAEATRDANSGRKAR